MNVSRVQLSTPSYSESQPNVNAKFDTNVNGRSALVAASNSTSATTLQSIANRSQTNQQTWQSNASPSFLTNAESLGREIRTVIQLRNQANQAQGMTVLEGLQALSQGLYGAQFAKQTAQQLRNQPGATSSLEQLEAAAQQYQLRALEAELITFGLEQLGVDASTMTVEGLFQAAGEYLGLSVGTQSAQTATSAGASTLGTTGSYLGAIGSIYSGYQMIDSWGESTPQAGAIQGATMGAYIGSNILPGVGTAVGAVLGAAAGALIGSISSGKHKDQKVRDSVRDFLQSRGTIDQDYQLRLANGGSYDIGKDGGHRYQNLDGSKRAPYQTDPSNPLTAQTIGWVDGFTVVLMGGNDKLHTDFAGYFVNAALSNATDLQSARQNVLAVFEQTGLTPQDVIAGLVQLRANNKITQHELEAYAHGFKTLLSEQLPTTGTP